ncbi:MAG: sodium:solute symporter, partial [Flavobacteriia bacterium]|nr:sodium:solute symporter [Flavobacteriia bacterium]
MEPGYILLLMAAYFGLLVLVARLSTGSSDNKTFFTGNRQSPWYVVSFGMIGASLSGVTFISVPGWVESQGFAYLQMVLGYVVGYALIAFVLLPLYYRENTTTIYGFLQSRYGRSAHATGAWFFILSRWVGASFRLYLVAAVLQRLVFDPLGLPFWLTVLLTLALIWLYTYRGGIRSVIFTDTLQTVAMLGALILSIYFIQSALTPEDLATWSNKVDTRIFFFDVADGRNFWKQFLGGIFITLAMTGLDQDMMQKNLTCRTLQESQRNMMTLAVVLIAVNFAFLLLGSDLSLYAMAHGIDAHGDALFPEVAVSAGLPTIVGVLFILGLIAAAYSSADSALTALTTSFCVDILGVEAKSEAEATRTRRLVHVGMTLAVAALIVCARPFVDASIIKNIFTAAGYTYGPLLGLFAYGLISTQRPAHTGWIPA